MDNIVTGKTFFFPRFIAFIIDMVIVSVISMSIMFLFPENKNYKEYLEEYQSVQVDYTEKKISDKEYLNKSVDMIYDLDYSNVPTLVVELVVYILYFMIFQYYNKGQTLGKKLMKIKVVSTKGDKLILNQVAVRALIIDSVFIDLSILIVLLFVSRDYYFYIKAVIMAVKYLLLMAALVMALFRKDGKGLHDLLGNTQVVNVK